MCSLLSAALKKYHAVNGELPEKIIVYRDGVGDGQLPAVVEHELKQIAEAVKLVSTEHQSVFIHIYLFFHCQL